MSPSKSKVASESRLSFPQKLGIEMEFRSDDDAWYDVRLAAEGKSLAVKYCEFPSDDETFNAVDFKSIDELVAFGERLRPLSSQLQDSQCLEVKEGMKVCASCELGPSERKFFDAIVEVVKHEKHDKECSCIFLLSWLHGPRAGTMTRAKVENICLIRPHAQTDPQLTSFLEIAAENFGETLSNGSKTKLGCGFQASFCCSCLNSFQVSSCLSVNQACKMHHISCELPWENYLPIDRNAGPNLSLLCLPLEVFDGLSRLSSVQKKAVTSVTGYMDMEKEGLNTYERIDDIDLGGARSGVRESDGCHFLVIDNLERDASISTILNFIHKQTSIYPEVYICPCLPYESYTQGVVMVGCLEDLEKLQNFLSKSDQIITSPRGRPWVVSSISNCEYFFSLFRGSKSTSQKEDNTGDKTGEHYRVILSGSSEYDKASKMRDLFMEFVNHQRGLHTRLVYEERQVLL